LGDANIDGKALVHVGRVQNLRKLDLSSTALESRDLVHLNGLSHLEELDLSFCRGVGDDALRHISTIRDSSSTL
jgi:Leucine-rich repeat (LRR) protein